MRGYGLPVNPDGDKRLRDARGLWRSHRPTLGSQEEAVSYERDTPVGVDETRDIQCLPLSHLMSDCSQVEMMDLRFNFGSNKTPGSSVCHLSARIAHVSLEIFKNITLE